MKKLLTVLLLTALGQAIAAGKPYNVLVIQTDEHHFKTLGCYGGEIVSTPNASTLSEVVMSTGTHARYEVPRSARSGGPM